MRHATLPTLQLLQGQLLWALHKGATPEGRDRRLLLDQIRYLRQLDVPFRERRRGRGRGRPISYSYEEAVEIAVGLAALRRGVRPHLVADYLITNRPALRHLYRTALEEQSAAALDASWLRSLGKELAVPANEQFLRLHNRTHEPHGTYEVVRPSAAHALEDFFGQRELFADGRTETLIPLTRLVLELVYWALRVPDIRPGRKTRTQESPTTSMVHA